MEAFSEKRQVAKLDLVEKSFLTVILCYRIDAPPLNRRWQRSGWSTEQGLARWAKGPSEAVGWNKLGLESDECEFVSILV